MSVTLVGGQVLSSTHAPGQCAGENCCIHNPSDHAMRDWTQNFNGKYMERISPDGLVYPDPDDPFAPESPNAATCRHCGTLIESFRVHDFVSCFCEAIFVDGGTSYQRLGWPDGDPADHMILMTFPYVRPQ